MSFAQHGPSSSPKKNRAAKYNLHMGNCILLPVAGFREWWSRQYTHSALALDSFAAQKIAWLMNYIGVVVKMMVPFWIPIIIRHLILGYPKRDHKFDNHPLVASGSPGT